MADHRASLGTARVMARETALGAKRGFIRASQESAAPGSTNVRSTQGLLLSLETNMFIMKMAAESVAKA